MMCLTPNPNGEPDAAASRSMSPVDNCGMQKRSTILVACVPFPAPGGPNRTSLINFAPLSRSALRPRDGVHDELPCFAAVAPSDHLHPLSRLQILVMFEEMLDLLDRD